METVPTQRMYDDGDKNLPKKLFTDCERFYNHLYLNCKGSDVGRGALEIELMDAFSYKYGMLPPSYLVAYAREGKQLSHVISDRHTQIHYVDSHYVTTHLEDRKVTIWDSLPTANMICRLKEQIDTIYRGKYHFIQHRIVQNQNNNFDCGPMAAAYAQLIIMKNERLEQIEVVQSMARATFAADLDTTESIDFPTTKNLCKQEDVLDMLEEPQENTQKTSHADELSTLEEAALEIEKCSNIATRNDSPPTHKKLTTRKQSSSKRRWSHLKVEADKQVEEHNKKSRMASWKTHHGKSTK